MHDRISPALPTLNPFIYIERYLVKAMSRSQAKQLTDILINPDFVQEKTNQSDHENYFTHIFKRKNLGGCRVELFSPPLECSKNYHADDFYLRVHQKTFKWIFLSVHILVKVDAILCFPVDLCV